MSDLTKYHLFISYSRKDDPWVHDLVKRLEREEWQGRPLRAFYATRDLPGGGFNLLEIEEAMLASCIVILVMTPDSMASQWVQDERMMAHQLALSKGQNCLIPLLLKNCKVPLYISSICRINFTDGDKFEVKYLELVATIRKHLRNGCCSSSLKLSEPFYLSRFIPRPPSIDFVRRYDDKHRDVLETVKAELAPSRNQLVALWGPGGMGKTTLAIMVARQMFEDFGGRVIWLNANLREGFGLSTMLDIIASRLWHDELRAYSPEQKREEVAALVSDTPTLIILDNFEAVKPEEQKLCEEWLKDEVNCPVLITTRERVESALNIAIGRMSLEDAREFLRRLIAEESHMSEAFEDFDYDHIIEAAEYNPLLLQWIIKQIAGAQEPEEVLRELAQGKGDAVERVFHRSFNLPQLGEDGRNVLLAFAPFAIRATRKSLAYVAGFGDDEKRFKQAVRKLSDLCLIEMREKNEKLFVRGLTRECIKQRLLESGRADEFYQRFVNYFLKYAEEHSQGTDEDFSALYKEKGNGANAMQMAFERKDWKSVIKFFATLREFLDRRRYWADLIDLSEKALIAVQHATAEGLPEQDSELKELFKQIPAIIGIEHRHREAAIKAYAKAMRYYKPKWRAAHAGSDERKKYADYVGVTLHQMAVLKQYDGKLHRARRFYRLALQLKKEAESLRGIGTILNNLGVIAEEEGKRDEAMRLLHEALEIFESQNLPYAEISRRNLERLTSQP